MSTHSITRRFINPSTLSTPPGYSQVVEVTGERTLFISGQAALDRTGRLVGQNDFCAQTTQVFENLKLALAAADADFSCVVKMTIYMVNISQIQALIAIRDRYINTATPPASSLIGVQTLAQPELLIEIDAIAVARSAQGGHA